MHRLACSQSQYTGRRLNCLVLCLAFQDYPSVSQCPQRTPAPVSSALALLPDKVKTGFVCTGEKQSQLRSRASAPWAMPLSYNKAVTATEPGKTSGSHLALTLAPPTLALPPIKAACASGPQEKTAHAYFRSGSLTEATGYMEMLPHKDTPSGPDR